MAVTDVLFLLDVSDFVNVNLTLWLHPPMNIGETLGIYELEIKHLKQFRASSIWEISLVILTIITNA